MDTERDTLKLAGVSMWAVCKECGVTEEHEAEGAAPGSAAHAPVRIVPHDYRTMTSERAGTAPAPARKPAAPGATTRSAAIPSAAPAPTPEGRTRDEQLLAAVRDATGSLTVADLTKALGTDARTLLRRLRPRLGLEHGTATDVLKHVRAHKEPLAVQLCGRPIEDLIPAGKVRSPLTEQDKQFIGAVLRHTPADGAGQLARTYNRPQAFIKHGLEQLGRRLGMPVTPAQLVAHIHHHQADILATAGLTEDLEFLPDLPSGRAEILNEQDAQFIGAVLRHTRTTTPTNLARAYNQTHGFIKHGLAALAQRLAAGVTPTQLVAYIHDNQAHVLAAAGLTEDMESLPDLPQGRASLATATPRSHAG
ncbi:hypothetical protein [Streptomyces sp. NPDC047981]|uniref:hypothetical protein n=1 Tax=Streptomyces sp. NPDC047981 TaxID=3154610 RepID=UPI00341D3D72